MMFTYFNKEFDFNKIFNDRYPVLETPCSLCDEVIRMIWNLMTLKVCSSVQN